MLRPLILLKSYTPIESGAIHVCVVLKTRVCTHGARAQFEVLLRNTSHIIRAYKYEKYARVYRALQGASSQDAPSASHSPPEAFPHGKLEGEPEASPPSPYGPFPRGLPPFTSYYFSSLMCYRGVLGGPPPSNT